MATRYDDSTGGTCIYVFTREGLTANITQSVVSVVLRLEVLILVPSAVLKMVSRPIMLRNSPLINYRFTRKVRLGPERLQGTSTGYSLT